MAQPTGYFPTGLWPDGYWVEGYWPLGEDVGNQDLSFDLSVVSALTSDRILVKKALTSDRLRLTT